METIERFVNPYMTLMSDYPDTAFEAESALGMKGRWRSEFGKPATYPLDLEIGTGNGFHFAHYAKTHQDRLLLGFELKYKPLIQSIRRALVQGSENVKVVRVDAGRLTDYFKPQELSKVIVHHPDPWPKKRHHRNRLIQFGFMEDLHNVIQAEGIVEFKTDDWNYFQWSVERFNKSKFSIVAYTEDLHNSLWAHENYVTHFEKIFSKKYQPIFFCRLKKTTT